MLPLSVLTSNPSSHLTPFASKTINLTENLPPKSSTDPTPMTISELLQSLPQESPFLYIDLPNHPLASQITKAALQNSKLSTVFLSNSYLSHPFSLFQLLTSPEIPLLSPRISFLFPLKSHPQILSLHKSLVTENLPISFLSITASLNNPSQALHLLVFLLNNQAPLDIQSFTNSSHTILTGNLPHSGLYHVQIEHSNPSNNSLNIEVTLSNGKTLSLDLKSNDLDEHSLTEKALKEGRPTPFEEIVLLARLTACVKKSQETNFPVKLKASDKENMVPFRTIGSAVFLMGGLFLPCVTNKGVYVDGLFTNTTEKLKEYFEFLLENGEPVSYQASFEEIYNNPYGEKGVFYIPSLAGKRKDSEMLKALEGNYTVLAEKPAFANADLAKEFAGNVMEEQKKRLFFGWHYLHTPYYRRLLENIDSGSHGKIRNISVNLTVPMIYPNPVRMFEEGQGGVGLDSLCYCLHIAMRLAGFKEDVKVLDSKIKTGRDVYPELEKLKDLDWSIKTNLEFSNGIAGSLSASFDSETVLSAIVEVTFDDGKVIRINGFNHPHILIKLRRTPILAKPEGKPWEFYITEEEKAQEGYKKSTYEHQIEFIRKHVTGEKVYDFEEDRDGLGLDYNVKLQEILDEIFVKGGIPKKSGA